VAVTLPTSFYAQCGDHYADIVWKYCDRMRAVVTSIVMVLVAFVAGGMYLKVGWERMATECGSKDQLIAKLNQFPEGPTQMSVSVSYSLQFPKGFTCEYSDGSKRSSYWF
jgi:hypothetical protein